MGELLAIGTFGRALRHLANEKGGAALEAARKVRTGDLLVYLALNLFERRRSFHSLPESIQRDIKAFCGTAKAAHEQATALLYSIGRPEVIETACKEAAATGLGLLDPGSSLRFHSSLAGRLPPVLRVYLGAAVRLFGEVETADVIKLHTRSGKVTLLLYDDFEGKPLPVLQERIKVDLRHQKVVYIDHCSDPTSLQVLFQKSRLITADFPHYEEQVAFDRRFVEMGLFDFSGFGPDLQTVSSVLTEHGLAIEGFHLTS
jgi:DNA phosphorothioation-associated putative methyltransferase